MMVSSMMMDHKPEKGEWGALNDSFENVDLDPLDMVEVICSGRSYTAVHSGRRAKENWAMSQFISIDLEKHPDAAIDVVVASPMFQTYGYLAYTTMSNTAENPRSRALFLLEKPVISMVLWHYAAKALTSMFGDAADKASCDVSRSFLGNKNADCRVYGKFMPYDLVHMMGSALKKKEDEEREERAKKYERYNANSGSVEGLTKVWLDKLYATSSGNRNNMLNKVAFMFGKFLVAKGRMSYMEAIGVLTQAGLAVGLEPDEISKTITQSLNKGEQS
jgi:hypothetical protein